MEKKPKNQQGKNSILRTVETINPDLTAISAEEQYKVLELRELTESTYVLRFDRNDMEFSAGQHITLGMPGDNQVREYSIYSTIYDPFLEVLIKEVEDGTVSRRLRKVKKGDLLSVDGPFGFFTTEEDQRKDKKLLFVATGTGLAPFHSLAGSHPEMDYTILHGTRFANEAYERDFYPEGKYIQCATRDKNVDFEGRVTDYLAAKEIDSDTLVYLCGNCDMIYEVYDLLTSRGIDSDQIKTEVYF